MYEHLRNVVTASGNVINASGNTVLEGVSVLSSDTGSCSIFVEVSISNTGIFTITETDAYTTQNSGRHRVSNNIDPYVVYIGQDTLPDFTQDPVASGFDLPILVPLDPPPSGERTFYIVTRLRNDVNLETAKEWTSIVKIDSLGQIVRGPITAPADLTIFMRMDNYIRVLSEYMAINTDGYPATHWKIFSKENTPPDPLIDTPDSTIAITSKRLRADIGPKTAGNWYVLVLLYRDSDDVVSDSIQDVVVVPEPPEPPTPVLGGNQI